jgi:MFS family permease
MNPQTRQTLLRLGAAYALAWATTSMVAGPGSAALVRLTGDLSHSGLYVALFYLGAAAGAASGGRAMDRYGRRRPLVAAYLLAATGFVAAGVGLQRESLAWFVAGITIFAAAFGTVNLTRLAAAEMFAPAERGRGVAWVQIAAIFGAVAGPVFLLLSQPLGTLLGREPAILVWFLAPLLQGIAAILAASAPEPVRFVGPPVAAPAPGDAFRERALSRRLVVAGSVSLAASQAAMASVMGVAGAAVAHAGHGTSVLGSLMLAHFVGMFALSRVVGRIADRVGRRATILTGLGLLASGGAVVALVPGPAGFAVGLLLVGFGWSFGFIGSTVLLTDASPPDRRARVLGRADLGAQLAAAVIATAGGWWFAARGMPGLGLAAAVVAATPILLLALVREREPGHYSIT